MVNNVIEQLIAVNAISPAQVEVCRSQMRHLHSEGQRVTLLDVIARNRFVQPSVIKQAQDAVDKATMGVETINTAELLPMELCTRLRAVPVGLAGGVLTVLVAHRLRDTERQMILRACASAVTLQVQPTDLVTLDSALTALTRDVSSFGNFLHLLRNRKDDSGQLLSQAVDALLAEAVRERASDIHIDKVEDPNCWVHFRIDGVLQPRHLLPESVMSRIVVRLKTLAGLSGSYVVEAQDGRLSLTYQARKIQFRVSSQPIVGGETLALRVQDYATLPGLEDMYPSQPEMQLLFMGLADVRGKKGGLILVTGATGSGKTTTLNALVQLLPRERCNVMTVEDPVEYETPFVRQVELNSYQRQSAVDLERSLLRQDPDVIMLGEIRDAKSARAGLKFAESGHLVLASLHADSATEVFERMAGFFDTEAEKREAVYVLAQHLLVSIHQSLAPKLCPACAKPETAESQRSHAAMYGIPVSIEGGGSYRRFGCVRCKETGIRGRALVHETLVISKETGVRKEVHARLKRGLENTASLAEVPGVRHITKQQTAKTLIESGIIDLEAASSVLHS